MRLVAGVDLHAENLIACGPVPVVVDCETVFTPQRRWLPSGRGLAMDRAGELIAGSVLRTGLLPGRGLALAWRGVDGSGAGSLPDQQPTTSMPIIVGAGTDEAHVDYGLVKPPVAANHPAPAPVLGRYWSQVLNGFDEFTDRLVELDRRGEVERLLVAFADCPVRLVPRGTEVYAEVERMLWHSISLHDEREAVQRASELLAAHSGAVPGAPSEPAVIAAEVADLLTGDVPVFTTTPRSGVLVGPRGTRLAEPENLIAAAVQRWRAADLALERHVIRASLVSAYLNDDFPATLVGSLLVRPVSADDLDRRRRALVTGLMRRVADAAIRGADGTVAWVGPTLTPVGWLVSPLGLDLYSGMPGVASQNDWRAHLATSALNSLST